VGRIDLSRCGFPVLHMLRAAAAAVALAAVLDAGSPQPALASWKSSASTSGLAVVSWTSLADISNKGRYSIVIGGTGEVRAMAAYPGKKLVYFSAPDVNTGLDMGVPWARANAHGWLLKDASGNLLVNSSYPSNNIGDVGSPGYQQAWISNVLRFLRAHPWLDGVHIDDVEIDIAQLTGGTEPAEYPTWQDWAAAQVSFMDAVGTALKAHGYYVEVNASAFVPGNQDVNDGTLTAEWFRRLAPHVSSISQELFAEAGNGALRSTGGAWDQEWNGWQRLINVAQSMGVDFVACMNGTAGDTRAMIYGRASFLLDWNGGGGAFLWVTDGNSDPWHKAWTADIGRPTGLKRHVGVGWMRPYAAGIALVNPSPSRSQTFRLRSRYLDASGTPVTSLTLAPTTGAILESTTSPSRHHHARHR
jgi:hypothetical protein